jgi:hypothetical protein
MTYLILTLCLSAGSNLFFFYKWKTKKVGLQEHHAALLEAIQEFESKRHALLEVQLINPDHVYLRNPAGGR